MRCSRCATTSSSTTMSACAPHHCVRSRLREFERTAISTGTIRVKKKKEEEEESTSEQETKEYRFSRSMIIVRRRHAALRRVVVFVTLGRLHRQLSNKRVSLTLTVAKRLKCLGCRWLPNVVISARPDPASTASAIPTTMTTTRNTLVRFHIYIDNEEMAARTTRVRP